MALETATELYMTLIDPEVSDERCIELIEADRAAVARAARLEMLEELETEALREYREQVGPDALDNGRKLIVAAGAFRTAIDTLKSKYGAAKEGG